MVYFGQPALLWFAHFTLAECLRGLRLTISTGLFIVVFYRVMLVRGLLKQERLSAVDRTRSLHEVPSMFWKSSQSYVSLHYAACSSVHAAW